MKIVKKIIIFFLYYSGLNWLRGHFLRRKLFCIGYHSIFDQKNEEELNWKLYSDISVSQFEKQLLFMKNNGHTFIHFSDLPELDIHKVIKPTIIFFDDGFKDVLLNALPVLKKHNIVATMFITTGLIDRSHLMWTLGLRAFLYDQGWNKPAIEVKVAEFKKLKMIEREASLTELYASHNFVLRPEKFNIFLGWEEVRALQRANIEIGSHGVSHQKLTELDDLALRHELVESKERLEKILSTPVTAVSYPYGRFNERVIALTAATGYETAVRGISGYNNLSQNDGGLHQYNRIGPEPGKTLTEFKVKLYWNI